MTNQIEFRGEIKGRYAVGTAARQTLINNADLLVTDLREAMMECLECRGGAKELNDSWAKVFACEKKLMQFMLAGYEK